MKQGVLDPTKVTRTALEHASSIAMLLLSTEALVGEVPKPKKKKATARAGSGGEHEEDYDDWD